ncbi:hypothetical protein LL253_15745 [Sphingobium soli]|uniref:Transposase n=1 Tax=Sphingobium soli TaxID=1591116 RepID=A0ABS8H9B0_9SPHN|nr:hypothetical protein [Sphingobium soli]
MMAMRIQQAPGDDAYVFQPPSPERLCEGLFPGFDGVFLQRVQLNLYQYSDFGRTLPIDETQITPQEHFTYG